MLERRATENYLTDGAIKEVFGDRFGELGHYERMKGPRSWGKRHNWRIAQRMTKDELVGTDLGKFLESL